MPLEDYPLGPNWQPELRRLAELMRLESQPEALGRHLRQLFADYNGDAGADRLRTKHALAARLAFSFARDVPKTSAALRELTGLVVPATGPLRLLDLGAGLGASTLGAFRVLAPRLAGRAVHVTLVDEDSDALDLAKRLLHFGAQELGLDVKVRAQQGSVFARGLYRSQRYHLVLLSQLLCELDRQMETDERVEGHVEWLRGLARRSLEKDAGVLLVIEPALRDRTRYLHLLRDRLIGRGLVPIAPCLHREGCPMLPQPKEWCHEDLPVDLPDWLVGLARSAGLRYQRLTFSYVAYAPGRTHPLLGESGGSAGQVRVVSQPAPSKGRTAFQFCGQLADGQGLLKTIRLKRDDKGRPADASRPAWADVRRGDLLELSPTPNLATSRLAKDASFRWLDGDS